MYIPFNPNPANRKTEDCVIRAVAKVLDIPWEKAYMELSVKGLELCDWGSSNAVWGEFLKDKGFVREIVPDTCPDCYTIEDFCKDNPIGTFVLGTGTHAVACVDGSYFDTWQSGDETPIYAYRKVSDDIVKEEGEDNGIQ